MFRFATALTLPFAAFVACAVPACTSSRPPPPAHLPVPVTSTTIGIGDLFGVQLVGEKDLPVEFRVAPDGTIDYPYIGRVNVVGLEPQELVDLLRKKLVAGKYLTDPQMSVIVKEYVSKRVTVIGQVGKPGEVPWSAGLKLVGALSAVGWFTPIADSNHIVLTRAVPPNKSVTAIVSVDAITDGEQADIPLQAGDTIKVESRVF
jgi:protein involved in polysaccharide export with SLBB domain